MAPPLFERKVRPIQPQPPIEVTPHSLILRRLRPNEVVYLTETLAAIDGRPMRDIPLVDVLPTLRRMAEDGKSA